MNIKHLILILVAASLSACGSGSNSQTSPITDGGWYRPAVGVDWHWQLDGTLNTDYAVEIYDIDLFDTSADTITGLQSEGKKVICYFSAGSYEEWREDAGDFASDDLGANLDEWEGERWLDIRSNNVRTVMLERLDLAQSKGCDGVEPDNVDGYANAPGFPLTAADQLEYNAFLANAAHERSLAVALKNDLDQVEALVDYFDFAVNEECDYYDECDALSPFIAKGKPVLHVEYHSDYVTSDSVFSALCADVAARSFSTLVLPLDLDDSFRKSCE